MSGPPNFLLDFMRTAAALDTAYGNLLRSIAPKINVSGYLSLCQLYNGPASVTSIKIGNKNNNYNLKQLKEAGYITMESDPNDKRFNVCIITEEGKNIVTRMRNECEGPLLEQLSQFMTGDLGEFRDNVRAISGVRIDL